MAFFLNYLDLTVTVSLTYMTFLSKTYFDFSAATNLAISSPNVANKLSIGLISWMAAGLVCDLHKFPILYFQNFINE